MLPREIIKKIRRIEIHTSRIVNELLAGQWNSAFKGRGIEFEEVRPYQIGDDVRAIDWNVTARMGRPFIKLFREEREMAVMLLVDLSASQSLGTHWQTKRELVTELSATLAFSAIKGNDKVGLTLFTDEDVDFGAAGGNFYVYSLAALVAAPEPASMLLLSIGIGGVLVVRRRRKTH